jgi:hypothetical protein
MIDEDADYSDDFGNQVARINEKFYGGKVHRK